MKDWITRNREILFPIFTVLVVALVVANSLKHGWLTTSILADNKDALDALNKVVTAIVVGVGAVFSYYRFFRGRTFFSRANLAMDVVVLPTTDEFNIHAVTLKVTNIGNLSIWEPVPEMKVRKYGPTGVEEEVWGAWGEAKASWEDQRMLSVVDSGETVTFIHHTQVDKETWAVTYMAFVRSRRKDIWKHSVTVSNLTNNKS